MVFLTPWVGVFQWHVRPLLSGDGTEDEGNPKKRSMISRFIFCISLMNKTFDGPGQAMLGAACYCLP